MAADLFQAVDTLTKAIEGLTQAVVASGADRRAFWVNVALAGITLIYVALTVWIARRTGEAARAARESADAATGLVNLTRDQVLASQRPMLHLLVSLPGSGGSPDWTVRVKNIGPGAALCPELSGEFHGKSGRAAALIENVPLETIIEPGMDVSYEFRPSIGIPSASFERLVAICHYEDLFSIPEHPRVYHSVADLSIHGRNVLQFFQRGRVPREYLGRSVLRYFAPEQLPEEYRHACIACESLPPLSGDPG